VLSLAKKRGLLRRHVIEQLLSSPTVAPVAPQTTNASRRPRQLECYWPAINPKRLKLQVTDLSLE
jgi:hypothetical protein